MMRHVGKVINTDQRCVVAFMQIPGRDSHALIVPTDTLPARYEQAVMEVLKSPEGQNDECLANVLARRLMPDNGRTVLQALHEGNFLVPVPVSDIVMLPMPGMPFPLSKVLTDMGRSIGMTDMNALTDSFNTDERRKFNPHEVNAKVNANENNRGIAQNLIIEAELLESDARRKREQAYRYAPDLAPKTVGQRNAELPTEASNRDIWGAPSGHIEPNLTRQKPAARMTSTKSPGPGQTPWGTPGTAEYEANVLAAMTVRDPTHNSDTKPKTSPAKRTPRAKKENAA